jgi:nucleotide-binding universal stress UspA family protein
LVLPPTPPESVAETVALVWSPTAQSARAMRSALPILQSAARVCILTNSETPSARPADPAAYLSGHGVASVARPFDGARRTARGRGRAILEAVRVVGADFLVMGGYGQNRLQSILGLGRATQKIVSSSPVPVLLQR